MDYYGKIYCIDVNEWDLGEEVFDDKPETIESSSVTTLSKHAQELCNYLSNQSFMPSSEIVKSMATSLLMKQIMHPDRDFLSRFKQLHEGINEETLQTIRSLLAKNVQQLAISERDVYLKNRSIDPRFQDELYLAMKQGHRILPPLSTTEQLLWGLRRDIPIDR
jgi:hypothetical protein